MFDQVKETIVKYGMLKKGDTVVTGVSGGPDSVALLFLLNSLKKEFNLTLHIAHLNHKLRGQDSEQDSSFVNNLGDRLKIPVTTAQEDVLKLAKIKKDSV